MSPRLPSAITSSPAARRVVADALERREPVGAERLEEGDLRLDRDDVGGDRVDDPAAEAGERVGRLGAAEHRLAAQLDGQQVEARIEPDDELAALALDRLRKPVGEGRGGDRGHAQRLGSQPDLRQRQYAQLRRRPAQERADQEQLVRVGRPERGLGAARGGQPCLGLRPAGVARQQRPRRGDTAAGDEIHPLEAVLRRRHEQAQLERAEPVELGQRPGDVLERSDPVAQPRSILEAQVGGQTLQLPPENGQRGGRLAVPVAERAGRRLGAPAGS